jgi:hypothetical protein
MAKTRKRAKAARRKAAPARRAAKGKSARRAAAKKRARKAPRRSVSKVTKRRGIGARIERAVEAVLDTLTEAERLHARTAGKAGFQELA